MALYCRNSEMQVWHFLAAAIPAIPPATPLTTTEGENEISSYFPLNFQIYHYMETCVPKEYHDFFMDISETAMFDEYIRGKVVGAFKNVEIVESKNGVMLIHCRKKSVSTSSMKQRPDLSPRSSDISKPFTPIPHETGKHY